MIYVPKTLVEQAYHMGRRHGEERCRLHQLRRIIKPIQIPVELIGDKLAEANYIAGQRDGEDCELYRIDSKAHGELAAEIADMLLAGELEMDRIEAKRGGA